MKSGAMAAIFTFSKLLIKSCSKLGAPRYAFLAKNVIKSEHNSSVPAESWTTAEPLLRRVGLCLKESAREMSSGNPTVLLPLEQIARQKRFV